MVKTRSGKRTGDSMSPPPKQKRVKRALTHLYIKEHPLSVSLTRENKSDFPNNTYTHVITPGTILYVSAQKYCNNKWYNSGRVSKHWIYKVFLTKEACEDWIKNYTCGEDKWIESSKIIETTLLE